MYWPVGTPRIYATSSSQSPSFNLIVSQDGLSARPPVQDSHWDRQPSLLATDPGTSQDGGQGLSVANSPATPLTPTTPQTPAIKSVEHGYVDSLSSPPPPGPTTARIPVREPILALRVARSGHIYATITATSMTIWQTKVRLPKAFCPRLSVN